MVSLIGALWLAGCGTPGDQNPGEQARSIAWHTDTVTLTADDLWIVANGQTFPAPLVPSDTHSDPGDPTYTTLELTWSDQAREMRFFVYFSADATSWWSSEMRTYNGQSPGDWLYYGGPFFTSPIGAAFHGDIDLTNATDDPLRGELHIRGLTLSTTLTGS